MRLSLKPKPTKNPLASTFSAAKTCHNASFGGSTAFFRITGQELDAETGLYYFGARYLDPRTSRWLSVDPAVGEYVPAPGQSAGDMPGLGGVFNYVNMHVYHYSANNPIKYVDPDGRIILPVASYSKMNQGPWAQNNTTLNNTDVLIREQGCALVGMANIATQRSADTFSQTYLFRYTTPDHLNSADNFAGDTARLDFNATASSFGMTARRSENPAAAQSMLINADISPKNSYALAQVPITVNDETLSHWVGVDGGTVNMLGESWIKVSPTSINDNSGRARANSNWKNMDGNMYVRLSAVTGAVIVE